jgi:thioredoxin 1
MAGVIDIQHSDWEAEVEREDRPVMVEFWHHQCAVCLEMKPIIEKLPGILGDGVKIVRMNLLESKENRKFAIRGGVRSTPTFIVFCKGEPTGQLIGSMEEQDFIDGIKVLIEIADKCVKGSPLEEV